MLLLQYKKVAPPSENLHPKLILEKKFTKRFAWLRHCHACNKCRYLYQFTKYQCGCRTLGSASSIGKSLCHLASIRLACMHCRIDTFLEMCLNCIAISPIETYQGVIIIFTILFHLDMKRSPRPFLDHNIIYPYY